MTPRTLLRRQLRERRRRLPPAARAHLSRAVARAVARTRAFRSARRLAVYLANDGEVDLTVLIGKAWEAGKETCLPVLWRGRLAFMPYGPGSGMRRNRFGIAEPTLPRRRRRAASSLDLVLVPLVAYDGRGSRLGMGGGYYDRTFAVSVHRRHWHRPLLLGVAYGFQRVDRLLAHPWDVPLHGVATEAGVEWFARGGTPRDA